MRLFAFVGVLLAPLAFAFEAPVAISPDTYPGKTWQHIANPGALGWSASGLDRLRKDLAATDAASMIVIYSGKELFAYGDVHAALRIASVRKSLLSAMSGNYVASGRIRLDATLADLGIDDVGGLSAKEKQATVRDLYRARSGVYHPAANKGDDLDKAPPRDSQAHGAYFLYNNWDFNALGTIFEGQTGQGIYEAFDRDIATPIGMEDYRASAQRKEHHDNISIHPAYHFDMSCADLARFGYLMLRGGRWNAKQVVPADWVRETTRVSTPLADMHPEELRHGSVGYGYLWWVWDGDWAKGAFEGAFTGRGYGGQYVSVLPALDIVVVLETPQRAAHPTKFADYQRLLHAVVRSRCASAPCP